MSAGKASGQGRQAGSTHCLSLLKEFLVEKEDEQVDIDLGLAEEFHDSHTLILELQEVLGGSAGQGEMEASSPCPAGATAVGTETPRPRWETKAKGQGRGRDQC